MVMGCCVTGVYACLLAFVCTVLKIVLIADSVLIFLQSVFSVVQPWLTFALSRSAVFGQG